MGYMLNSKQFGREQNLNRVYSSDKKGITKLFEQRNQSAIARGKNPKPVYSRIKEAQELGLVR
jgi:hypothetical protein